MILVYTGLGVDMLYCIYLFVVMIMTTTNNLWHFVLHLFLCLPITIQNVLFVWVSTADFSVADFCIYIVDVHICNVFLCQVW